MHICGLCLTPLGFKASNWYSIECLSSSLLSCVHVQVGDVVLSLEEVDEEWYVGEFAGRRGIVPKNYIQVL